MTTTGRNDVTTVVTSVTHASTVGDTLTLNTTAEYTMPEIPSNMKEVVTPHEWNGDSLGSSSLNAIVNSEEYM